MKVDLIKEDLWDHYSGLPNPQWYEYKKELEEDEEDSADNSSNMGTVDEKI